MADIRIALAQINTTVGDLDGNVAKIGAAIEQARDARADIVTFPELTVCGYPPEDLLLRPSFVQDNIDALNAVVPATQGICAVVGFADRVDGNVYNAAAVLHGGAMKGTSHKSELPNYGVFDEKRYFTPGTSHVLMEVNRVRLVASICEDVWVEGTAAERYARRMGAHVVLNLSASPFHAGKLAQRRDVLAAFARRTGAFVCYNNLVGGQDELVFDGGGLVIGPNGDVVASAKRFQEDLLVVDIEVDTGDADVPITQQTVAPGATHVLLESPPTAKREPSPARVAPGLDRIEEVYEALVLGTRDYTRKNGFGKVVIGLSGGIDSALCAAIAHGALGPDNVVGVTMPSQFTSSETRSDAEVVAGNLGIRLITVPIRSIFSAYLDVLAEPFRQGEPGLENENLQARIRGNILMALSNRFGWLVLTTGNKSETAVGYCTLYGDMAGGFAVIKDVPKTLVYEVSRYVNEKAGREIIPTSVLERAPTAELRPGQTDQDSLPPYEVLDPILRAYVEEDRSPAEVVEAGFDADLVGEVVRMVDRNEYKRRQAPPGVKITPKAFGRDRRLPMTNRYRPGHRPQ